jgi:hypothetical protein
MPTDFHPPATCQAFQDVHDFQDAEPAQAGPAQDESIGTLGQFDDAPSHFKKFVPVPPNNEPDAISHQTVTFRSGELLLADWFRVEQFTAATKKLDHFDIDTERGRALCTGAYAEQFSMVHVFVGNTSPRAYLGADGVIVGEWVGDDPDPVNVRNLGSVPTDLRWVSLIERAQLVAVVAGALGQEQAEQLVAEYLARSPDVKQIAVEPGEYHLYFHPNRVRFAQLFAADGFDLDGISQPLFILANKRLALEPALEPARAPAKKMAP